MPENKTIAAARKAEREGKAPTTQAGAFVHEEIEHIREGKHGARSAKQAIAIGLSKARRAGVKVPPPQTASKRTRQSATRDSARAGKSTKPSPRRSRAAKAALADEPHAAASTLALSRQAKAAARRRPANARKVAAKKR